MLVYPVPVQAPARRVRLPRCSSRRPPRAGTRSSGARRRLPRGSLAFTTKRCAHYRSLGLPLVTGTGHESTSARGCSRTARTDASAAAELRPPIQRLLAARLAPVACWPPLDALARRPALAQAERRLKFRTRRSVAGRHATARRASGGALAASAARGGARSIACFCSAQRSSPLAGRPSRGAGHARHASLRPRHAGHGLRSQGRAFNRPARSPHHEPLAFARSGLPSSGRREAAKCWGCRKAPQARNRVRSNAPPGGPAYGKDP